MKRDKILYFAWFFPPYRGSASFIHQEIAKKLSLMFDVEILSPFSRCLIRNGQIVKLKTFPKLHPGLMLMHYNLMCLQYYTKITRTIPEHMESIAFIISQHHFWHPASKWAIKTGIKLGKPIVIRIDDIFLDYESFDPITQKFYFMMFNEYIKLLKIPKIITVVSSEHKAIMINKLKIHPENVLIHPNFIDTSMFIKFKPKINFREVLGSPDYIITYSGSYTSYAGMKVLLKATKKIASEYRRIVVVLSIVNLSKRILRAIKRLIDKYDLNKKVIVISLPRKLVIDLILQSDILIGPISKHIVNYGAVPLKVLEYMALGKPVIVSSLISKDLAINRYNCIKIKTESEHELINTIEILINDKELRKYLGENARKHVINFFDSQKVNSNFMRKILNEVI